MDPHSFIARAEAQRWLGIAEKLLMGNDLVGSKTFAIRARESDPRLEAADQILAIADTLLAAQKPVVGNNGIQQPDLYAILQLLRFVQDADHIASQFRRLALALNPHHNRFPYSDQAFQLVNDAWAVLSNPIRKSLYDAELDVPPPPPPPQQQMNSLGFNLEQQQHQHNFFSINRMAATRSREQEFQSRVQQHNFLSQNPVRAVPVGEPEQMFQHQQQVQPPPLPVMQLSPQPPLFSWPQPPPPPPQLPTHINSSNNDDVREGETEADKADDENVDDPSSPPSFWTTCPYCFYLYEYPRAYVECILRCGTCKRAFQAVRISSPPEVVEGQESYFCCWGFFPLAVSMSHMQRNNGGAQTNSNWAPFSPMYAVVSTNVPDHLNEEPSNVQDHLYEEPVVPKKNKFVNGNSGPIIYIDDETDDIFDGIPDPSDDSDIEWNSTEKNKAKKMKEPVRDARNGKSKSLPSLLPASKKALGVTTRRQSGRAAKEMGKLDLNVEFNNNEGEEPTARTTGGSGNRGNVQGDGDNIEGIGFFEGLDEFFSSLPILSVVNDEKVKAG
ncbi:hypothetical protein SSX86_024592 [Deinandra increscens subsp. villosa]|uniref:J domain-containing protein n=1 Tax=Deinandra increscens subsp. villosa TaxID=3103831 RepID=A0AAP0GS19_9ASTR